VIIGVSLMIILFSVFLLDKFEVAGRVGQLAAGSTAPDDIQEAIFRYEMKAHRGIPERGADPSIIFFLSINNQDPSDAFMRRFSDIKLSVKRGSTFAASTKPPQRWISDRETGKPAVALSVGKIKWTFNHGVIVAGGYYCGTLCAGGGDFYVNLKDGRWVVEKFDIKVIS
jgi:hypothetical protein